MKYYMAFSKVLIFHPTLLFQPTCLLNFQKKSFQHIYSTVLNKRSYSNNHSYRKLPTKSIIVATGISIPSGKKLDMNF